MLIHSSCCLHHNDRKTLLKESWYYNIVSELPGLYTLKLFVIYHLLCLIYSEKHTIMVHISSGIFPYSHNLQCVSIPRLSSQKPSLNNRSGIYRRLLHQSWSEDQNMLEITMWMKGYTSAGVYYDGIIFNRSLIV